MSTHRILFVCLGNICRSPTAEGVFRHTVAARNLEHLFEIDSAGTGDWHLGAPPDERARHAAARRGIDLEGLRARQALRADMALFDYIIAMDHANRVALEELADDEQRHKIHLMLDFSDSIEQDEIPDPYYGGEQGFDRVLDMIEQASIDLLQHILDRT
jgi:protein-tyrosine phosphatase